MSNGDEEPDDDASENAPATTASPEEFEDRLDKAGTELEAAETEAALDTAEELLDDIEADLSEATFPEPNEDEDDPTEALESRLSELRDDLESQRGPYAEDVTAIVESAQGTLTDSEWTADGESDAHTAVETFLSDADEYVSVEADAGDTLDAAADALGAVGDTIEAAGLDPDADTETITGLVEVAQTLESGLEDAEVWSDLTVREQLDSKGFYDILTNENRKDFPPEWNAAKLHAEEGNLDLVLFAFEKLTSDFYEEYVVDIFYHLGRDAEPAFDVMHELAQKRNKGPVKVLGKIGDERATETLHEFIDGGGDAALQRVTLRALGSIGSTESVQPVANRLAAESDEVRSAAARALGLIGDTRAIKPLSERLKQDDSNTVRASAAWALRQIGTAVALDEAAQYTDDRAYLVQAEAEKAAST